MIPALFELGEEDHRLHGPDPLPDPGQQERLGGAKPDLVERRGVVREQEIVAVSRAPREAVAAHQQLDVPEGELRVAGDEPRGRVVFVREQLGLQVERQIVPDLHAALERQAVVEAPFERAPLLVHE